MEQFLFVGLGNEGAQFLGTRHNLGMEALRVWKEEYDKLPVANHQLHVTCLFPNTGMNNSGEPVAKFLSTTKMPVDNSIVIHDDVELPLGEVRVTLGGSAKGHNGVRSIHAALGTQEFYRLRLGVGRPPEGVPLNEFVLEKFRPEEKEIVREMIEKAGSELTARLAPE